MFRLHLHACTACVCQSLESKGDLKQMDTPVRAIVFSRFRHVFWLPLPQYLTEFYSSFEDMLPIDTVLSVSVLCKHSNTAYWFSSVPNKWNKREALWHFNYQLFDLHIRDSSDKSIEGCVAVASWISVHSTAFILLAGDDSVCLKCLEQGTRGPSHPGTASPCPYGLSLPVSPASSALAF